MRFSPNASGRVVESVDPWTPLLLGSALKGWWNADDHDTADMTDDGDGLISTWKDRIGGTAPTAATTARPTWGETAFNGAKAGLSFDGVANCFVTTSFSALPGGTTGGEVWIVCDQQQEAPASVTRIAMRYGASGSNNRSVEMARGGVANDEPRWKVHDGSANEVVGTPGQFIGPHIFMGWWNGAEMGARVNGVAFGPVAISSLNTGTTRLRIGAVNGTSGSGFWKGTIRHIFVPTILTLAQRLQLEGWIAWDSGLADRLPAGHLFKSERP